jgi:hypothetical protein
MRVSRALLLAAGFALIVPLARSGHEAPVYPSYYPHEIEIAAIAPRQAGDLMRGGKLHAYLGGALDFGGAPPAHIGVVESLGAMVVVRLNPESTLAGDEASACAAAGALVRDLQARAAGSGLVVHPYPVTPWHGDYLVHADLAESVRARIAAGGSDASASAGGAVKVRSQGALVQRLARPEWTGGGADWDFLVEEVDARALVAAAMVGVNGWLGPRWVRSGWFHAHRLLAGSIADPELRQRMDADLGRLQTGEVAGAVERANLERDLVRRLTAGCRGIVAGYTVRREYFDAGYATGIENIATDALEGLASPMFLRTVKLKDFPWNGWLKLGVAAAPEAAWNPVGGFTDEFGRLMWFAVGDPAAIPSPYDHGWVLNRISEVEANPRR